MVIWSWLDRMLAVGLRWRELASRSPALMISAWPQLRQITLTTIVAVFAPGQATVAPQAFVPTGPEDTTTQAVLLTPTPPPVASPEGQLICPFAFEPAE